MNKYLLTFLLFFVAISGISQINSKIDSLNKLLDSPTNDSLIALWSNSLFGLYVPINPDSSFYFGEKARKIAIRLENQRLIASNALNFGSYYWYKSDFNKAIEQYIKAAKLFKDHGTPKDIADVKANIGSVYLSIGNFDQALPYFKQSLPLYEELGHFSGIANIQNYLGVIYSSKENYDSAIFHFKLCAEYAIKSNSELIEARGISNVALIYSMQEKFDKARDYYLKSLKLEKRIGNEPGILKSYLQLGNLETKLGNFTSAKKYFQMAKDRPYIQNDLEGQKTLAEEYYALYEKEGRIDSAYAYYKLFTQLKDSISDSEDKAYINELNTQYETEKKENEILALQKDKALADLSIAAEKNKNLLLLIGSLLIAAILVFITYFYFQTRKKKKETDKRNELITNINKKLSQSQDDLLLANKTRDKFFALIAHDLRGPIASFQGIGKLIDYTLKKGNLENTQTLIHSVDESASRINSLLDNLLKWALSQTGSLSFSPVPVHLNVVLKDMIAIYEQSFLAKNISIENNIPEDLWVYADLNSISTVLRNLIGNALKFNEDGGSILLESKAINKHIEISVIDEGVGIPDDKLATIFNLNDKKSTAGTKGEKGTGLGLMLCKEFITKNGGEISIESTIGKGTRITFSLPIWEQHKNKESIEIGA